MTTETEVVIPVLRVLGNAPGGALRTGEVRRRVRETLRLDRHDLTPLANRSDQHIDQTIRNLKSHRQVPGNPFREGLIEDIPHGYAITARGRMLLSGTDDS